MREYHKIDSIFKRDERGKFIFGEFSRPEFEYLKDNPWLWTEKIDGTNIRIMWDGTKVSFGGKTDNAQIPTKLLNNLADHFKGQWKSSEEMFTEVFGTDGNVCLYGEGYGAGIQSGGNYSAEQKFILFDIKIAYWWLERKNVEDIASKLGLDIVREYFDYLTLNQAITLMQNGKDLIGVSAFNLPDGKPEGYVGTPVVPLFNRKGERIITKIKFKDFK